LRVLEYSSAHCSVCPNLGTAFTYERKQNLWDTDAAHKPCNAWVTNGVTYDDRSHLCDMNYSSGWFEH